MEITPDNLLRLTYITPDGTAYHVFSYTTNGYWIHPSDGRADFYVNDKALADSLKTNGRGYKYIWPGTEIINQYEIY
jgi:hypothetical protein